MPTNGWPLRELHCRILFSILVSNDDDHLKNHGFLYVGDGNWRLSPAFDINPNPDGALGCTRPSANSSDINLLSMQPSMRHRCSKFTKTMRSTMPAAWRRWSRVGGVLCVWRWAWAGTNAAGMRGRSVVLSNCARRSRERSPDARGRGADHASWSQVSSL